MTRDDTPTTDDETSDGTYGRRRYLQATTAAVVGTVGLAGCTGGDGGDGSGGDGGSDGGDGSDGSGGGDSETGVLSTSVTDDPGDIDDFESCVVTVAGYWLGPAPGAEDEEDEDDGTETPEGTESDDGTESATPTATETEEPAETEEAEETEEADDEDEEDDEDDGGRQYFELDEPAEADLVQLQDDSTQLIDDRELETGEHAYLQLDTDGVDAVLKEGGEATVEVPGEAPLKFNEAFEIRADTRTSFTADFTPVQRGQGTRYLLQPVASGVEVTYEPLEDGDGSGGTTEAGDGTTDAGESTTDGESDDGTTAAAE